MLTPFLPSCSSREPDEDLARGTCATLDLVPLFPQRMGSQSTSLGEPRAPALEAGPHSRALAPLAEPRGESEDSPTCA